MKNCFVRKTPSLRFAVVDLKVPIVQAVCDFRGMFMDVDCKWPGSVHDAKIFSNSSIGTKLRNQDMPITYQEIVPGKCKIRNYLIGDPVYPLTSYFMKEYDNCSSFSKVVFNSILRSARNPVECAFWMTKGTMELLNKEGCPSTWICSYSHLCKHFVFHNYYELNKCVIDPELVKIHIEKHRKEKENENYLPNPVLSGNLDEGEVVRYVLCCYIENGLNREWNRTQTSLLNLLTISE